VSRTVIVGAGIIGLACAHALRRHGEEVMLLDAGEPGGACSRGNAGWIVPSFSTPLPAPGLTIATLLRMLRRDGPLAIAPAALPGLAPWLWRFRRHCNRRDFVRGTRALAALAQDTASRLRSIEDDGVSFERHDAGVLFAYRRQEEMRRGGEGFALLHDNGAAMPRALSGDEARALEPALSNGVIGGYLIADESHVRPESLTAALAERAVALGAEVRSGVRVTGARRTSRGLVLETSDGDVQADRVLIAAGAWSASLGSSFGTRLPVQAGKGYSVTVESPPWSFRRAVYLADAHVACSPFAGAMRFAGTMELAGIDARLNRHRLDAVCRSAEPYLREEMPWGDGTAWAGLRPLTPDGLPLIGRLPVRGEVYVATGHAMLGMTLALATAELLARLIVRREAAPELAPFDPARFV
jgi:D-amino-acid dehydrogenase